MWRWPVPKITVSVSAEQVRVFEFLAEEVGAEPGEVLLALACERVRANAHFDDPVTELRGYCWDYSHRRSVPDASEWLPQEAMRRLGHAGGKLEVPHG